MSNDYIAPIISKLTYNGAANLLGVIEHPSDRYPDAINGGQRMFTGMGKWTHIAAMGVERHLIKLGLAENVMVERGKWETPWEFLFITPLGREVAIYLKANWNEIAPTLIDKTREATGR